MWLTLCVQTSPTDVPGKAHTAKWITNIILNDEIIPTLIYNTTADAAKLPENNLARQIDF